MGGDLRTAPEEEGRLDKSDPVAAVESAADPTAAASAAAATLCCDITDVKSDADGNTAATGLSEVEQGTVEKLKAAAMAYADGCAGGAADSSSGRDARNSSIWSMSTSYDGDSARCVSSL